MNLNVSFLMPNMGEMRGNHESVHAYIIGSTRVRFWNSFALFCCFGSDLVKGLPRPQNKYISVM